MLLALLAGLAAAASSDRPSTPRVTGRVLSAVVTALPPAEGAADLWARADLELCWTPGEPAAERYRIYSGAAGDPPSDFTPVAELRASATCWRGADTPDTDWAVATVSASGGEGERVLASRETLRRQGTQGREARLEGVNVSGLAEWGGTLWIATERGLSAAPVASPGGAAWSTWRGAAGPGFDEVYAVHVDADGVWVGGQGAVARLDPKTGLWRRWGAESGAPSGPITALITGPGGVLAGGERGRVSQYQAADDRWREVLSAAEDASPDDRLLGDDGQGRWWFATRAGLRAYLPFGQRWERMGRGERVVSLAADGRGSVWFGTDGDGLLQFEPDRGTWTTWAASAGPGDDHVRALLVDGDKLWAGTDHGLTALDLGTGAWIRGGSDAVDRLAGLPVTALHRDIGGALWVGVAGEGLRRVSGPTLDAWRPANMLAEGPIYAMASSRGDLWFAGENGVSRVTTARGEWAWWRQLGGGIRGPYQSLALSAPDQVLWVGGRGGVARFLASLGRWQAFALPDPDEQVTAVLPDGVSVWLGTDHGVRRLDLASGEVNPDDRFDKVEGRRITAMLADSSGSIWIATPEGAGRLRPDETLDLRPAGGALVGADLRAIEQDGAGALWFGTGDGRAIRYLRGSGDVSVLTTPDGAAITGIARDYNGVWFASDSGLLFWDSAVLGARLEPRLSAPGARAVAQDSASRMWLATERGVLRWERSSSVARRFRAAVRDPEREARILSLAPAGADRVWLGDAAGRLSLVDRTGALLDQISAADGLPTGEVRALLRDANGTLWVGQYGGGVTRLVLPEDPASRVVEPLSGPIGPGDDRISGLALGDHGEVCALIEGGATCLEAAGWTPLRAPRGLRGAVTTVFRDSRGRWWFGTEQGAGWRSQDQGTGVLEGLSQGVRSFMEDASGTLWLGLSDGGVARLARGGTRVVRTAEPKLTVAVRGLRMAGGQLWIASGQGVFTRRAPELATVPQTNLLRGSPDLVAELGGDWSAVTELALGPGTDDVYAIEADEAQGLWFATAGGALRWEAGVTSRVLPGPRPAARSAPPLLPGPDVGLPLRQVAAATVDGALIGEPSNPAAIVDATSACPGHPTRAELDWLLDTGDLMRLPGSAGARELLSPPMDAPRTLTALCDQRSALPVLTLCVGGAHQGQGRITCRVNALEWTTLSLPIDAAPAVTALLGAGDSALWVGLADGGLCHLNIGLGVEGAGPTCASEGLPKGAVVTLASDGADGVWVGSEAGLAHARPGAEDGLDLVDLPRSTPPNADAELAQLYEGWSRSAVRALAYDPSSGALWLAGQTWSLVRVGEPQRGGVTGAAVPPVQMIKRGGDEEVPRGALALGAGGRLWLLRGGTLYDYDGRALPRAFTRQIALGVSAALAAALALAGTLIFRSPVVRAFRRDPSSIERVPLSHLSMDLRILRLAEPGFGRATIGPTRMSALRELAGAWDGAPADLLHAAAQILDVEPAGDIQQDALPVRLAALGLALKRPDTLLMILPPEADPQVTLRERLTALQFHELVPALVIWRGEEPPALHGAVVLAEPDLRGLARDRKPRFRLASLLWQRSDLQGLSPFQAHGAVQDERMFFGRDAVLRELTASGRRRALLVIGPRKVGKTSVLVRAQAELKRRGSRTLYVTLRATVAGAYDLAVALARADRAPPPPPPEPNAGPADEAAILGGWIREHLMGANLLLDEADAFLRNDRLSGGVASEELRALVQEGVCALALAGYGTLYRAALSQSETAYNLGEPLYIGPLEREAAVRLATEPMQRMGILWVDPSLPEKLVDAVGCLAHLIQEACRRLLLRVRGFRAPELNSSDLNAVLGDWRPPGEPASLRELLINNVETNLKGPAQAAVWLLADERGAGFSLAELDQALRGAGMDDLDSERIIEVGLALQMSGVCSRGADHYRFLMPLLGQAVEDLDVSYRVSGLRDAWRALDPAARKTMRFWGGED